jgi:predicted metal-dependent hydrolase
MPATSSTILSNANSEPLFSGGGRTRSLTVRRMAQARAMRLSVDPRDGMVRLILPKRAALKTALAWVEGKRGWIETALAALPAPQPIAPGQHIAFEGGSLLVDWEASRSRVVRRAGERLVLGGPIESVSPRCLRWLRSQAAERLVEDTRYFAARAGVTVGRVSIGDPRARWGSCSASGDIRYSWRLILAPKEVREATVAHEVAHRLHMDHSPAFYAAVVKLLGRDPGPENRWLRAHGAALYWLGRDS